MPINVNQNVSAAVDASGGLMCQSFLCHICAFESFSTGEVEAGVRQIIFVIIITIKVIPFLPRGCFGPHADGLGKVVMCIPHWYATGGSSCKRSVIGD